MKYLSDVNVIRVAMGHKRKSLFVYAYSNVVIVKRWYHNYGYGNYIYVKTHAFSETGPMVIVRGVFEIKNFDEINFFNH